MIQRVQTIFLFLIVIGMGTCLFSTSWLETGQSGEQATLTAFQLEARRAGTVISSLPVYYIAILAVLAAGVAAYSAFQYRNRLLQIKLGTLNSLLMAALLGCIMYFSTQVGEGLVNPALQGRYATGLYAVILALICNMLANRFIRRDEQLVRSADRMR
ncbi:MAG: DUF4293 domain-containing protein [Ferruginibacter sp.]|nr:DUF4293 domain-containing protein [Cytophagales bacterium]